VSFKAEQIKQELRILRLTYFHRRTLYKNLNGSAFGRRLEGLINERTKGPAYFAEDMGLSVSYLLALINEPLAVSNPSAMLLKRMARRLDTKLSFLVGEVAEVDPVWVESHETLRRWLAETPDASAHGYLAIRDAWRADYQSHRDAVSILSNRAPQLMTVPMWDARYKAYVKSQKKSVEEIVALLS
jgi:transcriptional regulator with XRE-family HTH domain